MPALLASKNEVSKSNSTASIHKDVFAPLLCANHHPQATNNAMGAPAKTNKSIVRGNP